MKKEVDGVIVEAKSILTALKIIKTVCEDNECPTCPFGKNDNTTGKTLCMLCVAEILIIRQIELQEVQQNRD